MVLMCNVTSAPRLIVAQARNPAKASSTPNTMIAKMMTNEAGTALKPDWTRLAIPTAMPAIHNRSAPDPNIALAHMPSLKVRGRIIE